MSDETVGQLLKLVRKEVERRRNARFITQENALLIASEIPSVFTYEVAVRDETRPWLVNVYKCGWLQFKVDLHEDGSWERLIDELSNDRSEL